MGVSVPWAVWWGRMDVIGLETLPRSGPVLVAGNHDSKMDPVAIGVSARKRRQIRALAKSELWEGRVLAPILNGMRQIPIERGKGDRGALDKAIGALRAGACIGIFPEGTRSKGRELRARSGIGHLAAAVPEATVVCVAVSGTIDYARFPKRPRVRVRWFRPERGDYRPGEDPGEFSARLVAEIRSHAPIVASGRRARPIDADAHDAPTGRRRPIQGFSGTRGSPRP
jgi:1-acyl-sn-glycerol-3-phosphate acyltransferase